MSEITQITAQKKDKTRCNVFLDGRFYCGLKIETVVKARLKVGQEIDGGTLENLQFESEKQTAFDRALTHISLSQKTEKEVETFLKNKGYLPEVVAYVLEKMKEYGFLNDGEYAKAYADFQIKKKGRRMIQAELKRKGVSDEAIFSATATLEGEEETAKTLAEKYLRGKEKTKENLSKAYRYLLGKGFDYEIAKSAVSLFRGGEIGEDGEGGV